MAWRPKAGATRCAHCFLAHDATFFCTMQNALSAYQICCSAARARVITSPPRTSDLEQTQLVRREGDHLSRPQRTLIIMPSNPRKHKERAQNDWKGRRCAEAAAESVLLQTEETSELELRKCGARLQRAFMEDPEPASLEARQNAASMTRRPSSSQETWAPQPVGNCDSRVSSAVQHPLAVMQPQRNDGLRAWLRDKAGVAVRFLDDVVEVLTAEQVDGPEDLAFFATTPAFDAKLTATTAARIRAVLATEAAPSVAATCAPVDQEATQLLTRCTHSLHESDGGKAASSVAPELAADTALAVATPPVLCAQAPSAAIAPAGGPSPKEIMYLSVGGTPFTTRRSTLCRVPDSALAKMFTLDNKLSEPDKDRNGAYFLDSDPSVFAWLLCYLRLEQQLYDLPPADMIRSVRMEADFWGLKGLVDILDASLAQPCLADQRVEAVRFVNDGPNLCRLLGENDLTISQAVRQAIAAVYIRASEDEFGQPIFVAHGFSNLVLHNIFDEAASGWMVCDSAAKTRDNCNRCLLRCMAEVKLDDMGLEPAHTGVWKVRVCTSEKQCRFCEVPELALRFVPRSIALSLEVLVETNDVPLPLRRRRRRRRRRFANDVE